MAGMTQSIIANTALEDLQRALESGRCLVAIAHVEGDMPARIVLNFHAVDFPHGDYNTFIKLVRNEMAKELHRIQQDVVRAAAVATRPLVDESEASE